MSRPRVVIVGGGFAGLQAAQSLSRAPVEITLIDRRNFHLFQPLLYQVATGGLSPANIASPLRGILAGKRNVCVRKAEVIDFNVDAREVVLHDAVVPYDWLIVATGSTHSYFGNESWRAVAPGLKTVEDALQIRRQILTAFERAECEPDETRRQSLMTFVIVGGGPTGVELAGALSELANHTLKRNFCNIQTSNARIYLLEAADRLLTAYDNKLSQQALISLQKLGVTVCLNARVTSLKPGRVHWTVGDTTQTLSADTILWGAGVEASPLGAKLADSTGAQLDNQGRVLVNNDLSVGDYGQVFVLGDLALVQQAAASPLPGIAPVAIQQGKYVARLIKRRLLGKQVRPFRYRDLGKMAVIGRSAAVAEMGKMRFYGFVAWLVWLFIHLINLVEFENRALVLFQWSWNYITRNRSARLITNEVKIENAYSEVMADSDILTSSSRG